MMFVIVESASHSSDPNTLYAALRRKQLKLKQVEKEIETFNSVIFLLAHDENELSRSSSRRPESEMKSVLARLDSLPFHQSYFPPALIWTPTSRDDSRRRKD